MAFLLPLDEEERSEATMNRLLALVPVLLLAGAMPGCLDNPVDCDDPYWYDDGPPVDTPPPPGPPDLAGSVEMTSAIYTAQRGGSMTVSITVSNGYDVESAYDIEGVVVMWDGSIEYGQTTFYLDNLPGGASSRLSAGISFSKVPPSGTVLKMVLTWWDAYGDEYQKEIDGYTLFKVPA
jgi:hypothetical protein